jgi:hypothetical protein
MKIELTTEEIEKPGVATALSTLFAAVAGSFTVTPKDSSRTVINSYQPFGEKTFTEVTADEMERLIRHDEWSDGPFYGSPFVFGTLSMGTRVAYDRRRGTNAANAAVADAWAKKTDLTERLTNKYANSDLASGEMFPKKCDWAGGCNVRLPAGVPFCDQHE